MALILLQPGCEPFGQYDAADGYVTTCLGGEVCTFVSVTATADKMAADGYDGYLNPGTSRVALSLNLPTAASGPWMLVDEGTTNYGTLFGTVVGGTDGQVTSGAALGPHTATGSGKWTAWDKPGLYGVTIDALHTDLQPSTASVAPGDGLFARAGNQTNPGFLTKTSTGAANNGASGTMARFVEFRTKGSLVTTPNRLVSALNSPSSTVSGTLASTMYMGVVHFQPLG